MIGSIQYIRKSYKTGSRIRGRYALGLLVSLSHAAYRVTSPRRFSSNVEATSGASSPVSPQAQALQQTDLLDIYRGMVTSGRIKYDEDQIRVVMEVSSN